MTRRALLARLAAWLTRRALPYFNLHHADGSLYMGREWVMPRLLLDPDPDEEGALKPLAWLPAAARLHYIATPDYDREFHDHPWTFLSLVLTGGYIEWRPTSVIPCWRGDEEDSYEVRRGPGSLALRRYTDRHRIVSVEPGTLTLVVVFRKRQAWGFFTPRGKVHWRDYESVHNSAPIVAAISAATMAACRRGG